MVINMNVLSEINILVKHIELAVGKSKMISLYGPLDEFVSNIERFMAQSNVSNETMKGIRKIVTRGMQPLSDSPATIDTLHDLAVVLKQNAEPCI